MKRGARAMPRPQKSWLLSFGAGNTVVDRGVPECRSDRGQL